MIKSVILRLRSKNIQNYFNLTIYAGQMPVEEYTSKLIFVQTTHGEINDHKS